MYKLDIREHRKSAGLTQEQLSKLFNPQIPIDTIKNWDSGRRKPPEWAEKLIIEKIKGYQKGNLEVILTQEDISIIMTALTVAKMDAEEKIKESKSKEEKELRESTAKEWGDAQWEIGVKLRYYTRRKESLEEENTEDLMMKMLKDFEGSMELKEQ